MQRRKRERTEWGWGKAVKVMTHMLKQVLKHRRRLEL
jgi:hypothetical protein